MLREVCLSVLADLLARVFRAGWAPISTHVGHSRQLYLLKVATDAGREKEGETHKDSLQTDAERRNEANVRIIDPCID